MLFVKLRLPDCSDSQALPHCGMIKRVVNLSSRDICIEIRPPGYCGRGSVIGVEAIGDEAVADGWAPLVPLVRATSIYNPVNSCLWAPRGSKVRAVDPTSGLHLHDFGVLGDTMLLVHPPDRR